MFLRPGYYLCLLSKIEVKGFVPHHAPFVLLNIIINICHLLLSISHIDFIESALTLEPFAMHSAHFEKTKG